MIRIVNELLGKWRKFYQDQNKLNPKKYGIVLVKIKVVTQHPSLHFLIQWSMLKDQKQKKSIYLRFYCLRLPTRDCTLGMVVTTVTVTSNNAPLKITCLVVVPLWKMHNLVKERKYMVWNSCIFCRFKRSPESSYMLSGFEKSTTYI